MNKIPLVNDVIEEEDENDIQSDGNDQGDSNILTNLTNLRKNESSEA